MNRSYAVVSLPQHIWGKLPFLAIIIPAQLVQDSVVETYTCKSGF
jgi:hypothetical protein